MDGAQVGPGRKVSGAARLFLFVGAAMTLPVLTTPVSTTAAAAQSWDDLKLPYDGRYSFVRLRYGTPGGYGGWRRGPLWAHDYPRAEVNFLQILDEVTFVRPRTDGSIVLSLDDPEIFLNPILYIVEVGYWEPTDDEVRALGEHLSKGGFLIVDDTRNERGFEWANFQRHMERALPDHDLVPLPHDHEIFDSFFRIDPLAVIPPYGPINPLWFGIFENNDLNGRLMAVFNFNNDIAEYWEFSSGGWYPIDPTNEAYKLGVNYIVYALTH